MPAAPDLLRCPTHYRDRLARIVYWYARGDGLDEIARRVSYFGTPWGIERVLDTACRGIAACLNRQPDLYGYDPRR